VFSGVGGELLGVGSGGVTAGDAQDSDGACFVCGDVGDVAFDQKYL
jgi:hypothetical protein